MALILSSLVLLSCNNNNDRISVSGYTIGKVISSDSIQVIVDNTDLDFPYKEVCLKTNNNIIFNIVGDNNVIYQITQTNISLEQQGKLIDLISMKLDSEPERKDNIVLSNIWLCDLFVWDDVNTRDNITLSCCSHKNDSLTTRSTWELTIKNDYFSEKLQKSYEKK